MLANHLFDDPPKVGTPDIAKGEAAARAEAAAGTVLLKNNGVLPLLRGRNASRSSAASPISG